MKMKNCKQLFVFIFSLVIATGCSLVQKMNSSSDIEFYSELELRGGHYFKEIDNGQSVFGEARLTPSLEYYPKNGKVRFSADVRQRGPDHEVYEESFQAVRKDGKKPAVLLQEIFFNRDLGKFNFRIGRQKPDFKNEIIFDFTKLSPFDQLDSSEPFLSLDDDRLLGSWGGLASYKLGAVNLEIMAFYHEDPIIATHEDDRWTRPLPFGFDYGPFKTGPSVDLGGRLSGDLKSAKWELLFFHGSSQNVNHLEIDLADREFDLIFPKQTSIQGAAQLPVGPFNLRLGAAHHWREWQGENAGEFLTGIAELEYIKENVWRSGDNLFLEVGYADVWDTSNSELFQNNIGLDQIYRGGSLLFVAEYSPSNDLVFKLRTIWNTKHDSYYISPEVRKTFFTDSLGEYDVYLRGMIIGGGADDVLSSYRENDNVELGVRFNF
jgi:hypothetical protein